jgi:RHS repeat-associated protein
MLESTPTTDFGACSLSVAFWNFYKFIGKERDAESGLDNFGARYNASSMGRFMTPDWAAKPTAVPYAHYGDPQSLNLYAHVGNNPLSRTDPTGHYLCNGDQCKQVAAALDAIKKAATSMNFWFGVLRIRWCELCCASDRERNRKTGLRAPTLQP